MRRIAIIHQYGAPSHFEALRALPGTHVVEFAADPLFLLYKLLTGRWALRRVAALLRSNWRAMLQIAGRRCDVAILAMPPGHPLLGIFLAALPSAGFGVYFTSFSEWEERQRGPAACIYRINRAAIALSVRAVAAVNLASQRAFARHLPCVLVEHAVSGSFAARAAAPVAIRTIVYVGRVVRYKRIERLIEGCARSGVQLTVIGGGDDPAYEAELRSGAGPQTDWLGGRSQEWIRGNLAGFDAAALISDPREPFGIAIIEALAAGLPVIVTRTAGTETIFRDWPDYPLMLSAEGGISDEIERVVAGYNRMSEAGRMAFSARLRTLAAGYEAAAAAEKWRPLLSDETFVCV